MRRVQDKRNIRRSEVKRAGLALLVVVFPLVLFVVPFPLRREAFLSLVHHGAAYLIIPIGAHPRASKKLRK